MKLLFLVILFSFQTQASLKEAARSYRNGKPRLSDLKRMITNTVEAGYPITAMPWLKEYIANRGQVSSEVDKAIEAIIDAAGVKPFQTLDIEILDGVNSSSVKYVIAKKYFSRGKQTIALKYLNDVSSKSKVYPYAVHMKAVIHSLENRQELAEQHFQDCIRYSDNLASSEKSKLKTKQYIMNRDYCIAGLARAQFARRNFNKSDLSYLDVSKSSQVWPEILFEEAWNSFYQGNYNRTLGKLVTYKAPVFSHVFKPEAEVLVALSYLKLCLYKDAKEAVDKFYDQYLTPARGLRQFLKSQRDYSYYYKMAIDVEKGNMPRSPLLARVVSSISNEQAYKEIAESLQMALREAQEVKQMPKSRFQRAMWGNLREVVNSQKTILGSYIRNRAIAKYAELYRAFQDMSYIKLEVLAQRKQRLYEIGKSSSGKRGDTRYIETNEKQYFWSFNGEFWADELGDYVFALQSQCGA